MRIPAVLTRRHRAESLDRERSFDYLPRLAQRANRAGRDHLHGQVPECGRFDRAGDDGPTGRVGRELVEQAIAGSAADDLDLL